MKSFSSIFWFVFTLFLFNTITAQVEKDTLQAWRFYQKADSLLAADEDRRSIEYFQKALPIYEKAEAWERTAACYNNISNVYWRNSKLDVSIENAQNALEICAKHLSSDILQEALAYDNLGLCYEEKLEFQRALDLYHKALTIKQKLLPENHLLIGSSYQNLGSVADSYNDIDSALKYYEKHLKISVNARGEDHEYTANSYNNVATVLEATGKYEKALQYYQKALKTRLKLFGEENYHVSSSYNNLGVLYKNLGHYDKALDYYQKTIKIRKKIFDDQSPRLIGPYHNVGLTYDELGQFEQALESYKKGLSIIIKLFDDDHIYSAHSYENFGDHYLLQGNYDKALEYYTKSQKIYIEFLGNNNAQVTYVYNQMGLAYFKMKEYDSAIEFYNKAIDVNLKKDAENKVDLDNFLDLNSLLVTYEGKAKTLRFKYNENRNLEKLNESISMYQRSDTIVSHLRNSINNYKDKLIFTEKSKEVYKGAIKAQMLDYKQQQNQKSLEKTFYFVEKSKANTLKELLNISTAENFGQLPTDIVSLEKSIKTDKAFYLSQLATEESKKTSIDTLKIKEFESQLFDLNRKQDSLTTLVEKNYPKYYQLKYKNEVASVSDIQNNLEDNTTLLEFFTADSITYTFIITKNELVVKELSTPNLQQDIELLRKSIIDKNVNAFKSQSHNLYQQLIDPIKDQLTGDQLVIIPDGSLWHLNFDLLLTQSTNSNNPKELPYWLKDYTISYANSATILFNSFKDQKRSAVAEECLAFSFSDSTNSKEATNMSLATLRDAGDDLPGTREEIRAISNIIDGQYYFGSKAIEANFKRNADKYRILHLALHGEVDNERPENSRLFFTKSNDTIEDNYLYSHELFALNIPAELTVLSACNTGTGKLAKGEGIMSLGNAFQYAGAKSLLLTSWEVSDQTTPELMKYFYKNLKTGMSKAKALRQAKLEYLSTANVNRTHPFYWGGFYLVGDHTPIEFNDNSFLYWILGIGLLVMLSSILIWRVRRTEK